MICPACRREVDPAKHFYAIKGTPRCDRPFSRVWTQAKRFRLMQGIERGWTDERIGAELGVTAMAVRIARKRYAVASRHAMRRSACGVAKRLGVSCAKTVIRWIERGFLRGVRAGARCGARRQWWVEDGALTAFLEDERYWHLWRPERIADPYLKQWATKLRGDVRFLTIGDVAERLYQETNTVGAWVQKGWLPSVRTGIDRGNHLVRESDLAGFELPRIGGPRRKAAA